MPDLDRTPVMDWITACVPALMTWCEEPIRAVEDESDVQKGLIELGISLALPALQMGEVCVVLERAGVARDFRTILTQLGPARLMRLFRWLGTEGGDERATVLQSLLHDQHPDAQALRAALDALNKRELLARIFDEVRLQELLAATKTAAEGAAT